MCVVLWKREEAAWIPACLSTADHISEVEGAVPTEIFPDIDALVDDFAIAADGHVIGLVIGSDVAEAQVPRRVVRRGVEAPKAPLAHRT